jgi:hypothetical protein
MRDLRRIVAEVSAPIATAIAIAYQTISSASDRSVLPSRRATADSTPPPIAPWEMAPTSDTRGKTCETPASASTPSFARKYSSIKPSETCVAMTAALGTANRMMVRSSGASRMMRVRASISASEIAVDVGVEDVIARLLGELGHRHG